MGPLLSYGTAQLDGLAIVEADYLASKIYNNIYKKYLLVEAKNMYHSFIDTYYSYPTKRYYRHGTGRGTGTGVSLYEAEDFSVNYGKGGSMPELVFNFNSGALPGYKHDSNESVLMNVLMGNRGIPGLRGFTTWSADYSGPYFAFSSPPKSAFENLYKSAEMIADSNSFVENEIPNHEAEINESVKSIVKVVIERMLTKLKKDITKGVIDFV